SRGLGSGRFRGGGFLGRRAARAQRQGEDQHQGDDGKNLFHCYRYLLKVFGSHDRACDWQALQAYVACLLPAQGLKRLYLLSEPFFLLKYTTAAITITTSTMMPITAPELMPVLSVAAGSAGASSAGASVAAGASSAGASSAGASSAAVPLPSFSRSRREVPPKSTASSHSVG